MTIRLDGIDLAAHDRFVDGIPFDDLARLRHEAPVSANYDEGEFDEPHRFDVGREHNPHVTFGGGGPHFCLGAHLARLELRIVLEELLDRIPDIAPAGPAERMRSNWTNGLKRLPVRW